ncbi:LCP family protein [Calidifontibacter terrae]
MTDPNEPDDHTAAAPDPEASPLPAAGKPAEDPRLDEGRAHNPGGVDDNGDDFDDNGGEEDEKKRAGCFKVGCITLLAMALITILAVGGFAAYLNYKFDHNINKQALLPTGSGPTRDAQAGDSQNILLLGSDSRSKDVTDGSRSDVIQLVHISNDHKTVQIIHFPRDLYVAIPGHGKNKINAAYAYGKVPLLVQTIQNLLGVKIDSAAIIGFDGFSKLTNTVGGVDLFVPQAYNEPGFGTWSVGVHHMNGAQALAFVRERHQLAEGDIDRGRNQQRWIKAVLSKTLQAGTLLNPLKLSQVVDDVTADGNLTVDKNLDLKGLGWQMRSLRMSNVSFYTAPFTGFAKNPTAGDIDVVDEAKMKTLGTALRIDDFSNYTGAKNALQ